MKFKWNLQQEFARYKERQKEHIVDENIEGSGEYIGNVRFGNLCYDIIDWGDHLWFELFVGGVDTGYGYGVDDYPYDFCDLAGFKWSDNLSEVSDEELTRELEAYIEEHINAIDGYVTDVKAIPVNLVDKANEELREW